MPSYKASMRHFILSMIGMLYCTYSFGQSAMDMLQVEGICDSAGYCIPGIEGLPKPKGFEFKYNRIRNYDIETSIGADQYEGEVDRNRETTVKLTLPVIRKEHFFFAMGAKYETEEFRFKDPSINSNPFYQRLEDKALRSFGLTGYFARSLKVDRFLVGRLSARLNGDVEKGSLSNYLRSTISVIYGQKKSATVSRGVGLTYNNSFGRQLVLPILTYNRKLTKKLSMKMLLPVNVELICKLNEKNILLWNNELSGDNYLISIRPIINENLYLSKSDFLSTLTYEREVYDFIWLSASTGYNINYRFNLSETNNVLSTDVTAITNTIQNAMSFQLSLFLVPPKNWK